MFDDETIYGTAYDWADDSEDLPWHREAVPPLLHAFLGDCSETYRVLDLGSGSGTIGIELADRGHEVVGVDLIEDAIEMGRRRADERGVDIEFFRSDILEWEASQPFDIVVDCGLLHVLSGEQIEEYGPKLREWLADDGDYFLSHFVPRHRFDWRPMGPTRRSADELTELLPDELTLETRACETIYPFFLAGPVARFGHFWFSSG